MSATIQNVHELDSKKDGQLSENTIRSITTDVSETVPGISGTVPLTFDPTNTNDCPTMFAEKWTAEG